LQQQRLLSWRLLQLQQQAATVLLWALRLRLVTAQCLALQLASSSAAVLQRPASAAARRQRWLLQLPLQRHPLQQQAQLGCRRLRRQQDQQHLQLV
jgi:hypothetical protein